MSTNLLIGYPQIATNSSITSDATFDSYYPLANSIYGSRSDYTKVSPNVNVYEIIYDAGTVTSRTIDFVFFANASIVKAMGSKRIGLTASDDNITYNNVAMSASSFQTKTLRGAEARDLIWTNEINEYDTGSLPYTTPRRYYKAHLAGSGTCATSGYTHSQIMFGQWFDFGRDPEWNGLSFRSISGQRKPAIVVELVFRGIDKTIKANADEFLFSRKERGAILYTKNYHSPLFDFRVLHGYIAQHNISAVTDGSYDISFTFVEMI